MIQSTNISVKSGTTELLTWMQCSGDGGHQRQGPFIARCNEFEVLRIERGTDALLGVVSSILWQSTCCNNSDQKEDLSLSKKKRASEFSTRFTYRGTKKPLTLRCEDVPCQERDQPRTPRMQPSQKRPRCLAFVVALAKDSSN